MMHLRGLILSLWFVTGGARRSMRVSDSHQDSQQQNHTLTNRHQASGIWFPFTHRFKVAREALSGLPVASPSQPSVLQSLAQGAGIKGRLTSDSEAAKSLFKHWYPISHLLKQSPGYDPRIYGGALTYGELEPEGVDRILERVAETSVPLNKNDVFADLGSGVGQVALQVFLQAFPGQTIGVEIMPDRHELAAKAREKALDALSALGIDGRSNALQFFNCDFRDNSQWKEATVIYTSSLLMPDDLISDLQEQLIAILPPGAMVFSLKRLGGNHKDLAPIDGIDVQVSWQPAITAFVYMRNLDPVKLNKLKSAVIESGSVLEDCISWGRQNGYFTTEELMRRFCYTFAWKREEMVR